jgi:tetratricopeptide (TPR) repeat protein
LPEEKSPPGTIPFEIDTARFEETLEKIRSELLRWANKGRYTRVRFKFRGRQLLPDIPLAAVVAAEGLSFYWAGLLRALVVNVAGGALVDVELVNDSEKVIAQGREALLSGDVEKALELFRKATEMDADSAQAWLNVGVASKLRGDVAGAREALEKARSLAGTGPVSAEAERVLKTIGNESSPPPPPSVDWPP